MTATTRPPAAVTNNGIQIYHALTDPLDLGRHAMYWFIGNSTASAPIYFDLNCAHHIQGQSPQWISIPLKNEATSDGLYYREERKSLVQRRVNLSLVPRFYTKIYVRYQGSIPQDPSQFDVIMQKYRHHPWLRHVQIGLLLRVPLDWFALSLFYAFSQAPKLSTVAGSPIHVFAVASLLAFFDEASSIIPGKKNRAWLKGFFWLLVCLTAPVPIKLVGTFALAWNVVDLLVPYRPFQPDIVIGGVVSEGKKGS